jgi:mannosyltransferase OCH1-like enzyme
MNLMFTSNVSYTKQYSSGIYNYTKKASQSQVGLPTLIQQKSISNLKNLKKVTHVKKVNTPKTSLNITPQKKSLIYCDELFREIEIDESTIDNTKIPKYIFQTWKQKLLSDEMKTNLLNLRNQHKDFSFYLYDDDMCIKFLKEHYSIEVLYAFDTLLPGPYKADLWRYCVLYKYGGIYMDIKLNCINGFNLNQLIQEECFPKDIPHKQFGIWQGLLICKPNNKIIKKCIDSICMHVKFRFYGNTFLSVTGPHLMFNILAKYKKINVYNNSKVKLVRKNKNLYLYYNNKPIINFYKEWYYDRDISGPRYAGLWYKRNIYK